ncbi:MAG: hypothetical protein RI897_2939, partial [Verrucomicrobiota bacterium]
MSSQGVVTVTGATVVTRPGVDLVLPDLSITSGSMATDGALTVGDLT